MTANNEAILTFGSVSATLGTRSVLREVSFEARGGEFVGVIGPNGAGKSTLLKLAAGILKANAGERLINGDDISALTPLQRARRIGYLPQARPVYWSMPVHALIGLGRFAYGARMAATENDRSIVERAARKAGVADLMARSVGELSGGELARVHLARVFAGDAAVMLLDEPTNALDPAGQLAVMSLLRRRAETGLILAAVHDIALAARYCTRLLVISNGEIACDAEPQEALTPQLLRDVFSVDAKIQGRGDTLDLRMSPLA